MTPAQFRKARIALGLSTYALAHILNVEQRTVRRWEDEGPSGRPPNPMACRVLEWMDGGFRPVQWPER